MKTSVSREIEQIVVPVVCFLAIFLVHARYLKTWLSPSIWADPHAVVELSTVHNLRTFFVGIRTRWVLENHGHTSVAVQTLRDMISITTATASASMAFISIFIGLSKSNFVNLNLISCKPVDGVPCSTFEERLRFARCKPVDGVPCSTFEERLRFARFGLCIGNFVIIFFNMLLATRYAMNSSFMMNTKEVDGKPLSQMLTVNVLARASWHYTLGIRGFFLAAPLVSWLFGSWMLLGTTVLYVVGVALMEEDFLLTEEVWRDMPDDHIHHGETRQEGWRKEEEGGKEGGKEGIKEGGREGVAAVVSPRRRRPSREEAVLLQAV